MTTPTDRAPEWAELRWLAEAATRRGAWIAEQWGADAAVRRPDGSRIVVGDALYHPDNLADAALIVAAVNALPRLLSHVTDLERSRERMREALEWIGRFASAHHGDQPAHVFLHGLTVDIPSYVERALSAATQEQSSNAD